MQASRGIPVNGTRGTDRHGLNYVEVQVSWNGIGGVGGKSRSRVAHNEGKDEGKTGADCQTMGERKSVYG